jgi:uncharacterized membrane protein (DUF4010 family)
MNRWFDLLHVNSTAFPPAITALKLTVALAIGFLIGFERQWSRKDFGIRTFSLTALLGALTALISAPAMHIGMIATVLMAVLLNVRDIVATKAVEGTTSIALIVTFVLGALIGNGHMFTSVACAIVTTWLLSLKPQFKQFAGGVTAEEIRSAVMLGLFGFVIWPLLPNHYVDPWKLLQPREIWITVVIVACIGFVNYVLLRIYGKRGVALTAILGGLVNSTAAAAELSTSLPAAGLLSQTPRAVLLTSVAMFIRNGLLLALFGLSALRFAVLPLLAMMLVAAYFAVRSTQVKGDAEEVELHLASPVSVKKVANFGLLFLLIQIVGTIVIRWFGNSGVLLVSVIGGMVSSASTTVAAANLLTHNSVTAMQAATATVLTSIASTAMNLPIVKRQIRDSSIVRKIVTATTLQAVIGVAVLIVERRLLR